MDLIFLPPAAELARTRLQGNDPEVNYSASIPFLLSPRHPIVLLTIIGRDLGSKSPP